MNGLKQMKTLLLSLIATGALTAAAVAAEPATQKVTLSNADCAKCHEKVSADVAQHGAKHKTAVTCQDCHVGHPPAVKNIIPACSNCHSGKPHYKLPDCKRCHNNPHIPKVIKLANNLTNECTSCHANQITQLKQHPSKHSKLACSLCHNVHGRIPPCTQCHKPHSSDMVSADCKRCHKAHMPTVINYKSDTTNAMCVSCHKKAGELMAKTETKHKAVTCVACHKDKHKYVPTCQSCHGTPHSAGMLARFNKCGECHSTAHDLNRWDGKAPEAGKPAAAKPAAAPAKKPAKK